MIPRLFCPAGAANHWPGATQELCAAVSDPTEGDQPHGKQSRKPEGIFYTASSGIWQTVWLEPVPEWHVSGVYLTPDFTNATMRAVVMASTPGGVGQVEVEAWYGGQEAGRGTGEGY